MGKSLQEAEAECRKCCDLIQYYKEILPGPLEERELGDSGERFRLVPSPFRTDFWSDALEFSYVASA